MNAKPQELTPLPRDTNVIAADAGAIMTAITRAASDPAVSVEKVERMTDLYLRIRAIDARAEYMRALSEMQPQLPVIEKRGRIKIKANDPGQPYAKWEDINEKIKPFLRQYGFTLSFRTGTTAEGRITVTGILGHAAGHQEETTITLPHDSSGSKNAVQAVGSSTSYGKRYTAGALLNLVYQDEDDDGEAAGAGETISADQVKALQAAVIEVDADLPKFLRYMKVERLDDLPAAQFQSAMDALTAKRKGAAK